MFGKRQLVVRKAPATDPQYEQRPTRTIRLRPRCLAQAPEQMLKINHGAGGIGDALLGLTITRGLQAQGYQIAYAVSPLAQPFVALFEGCDFLAEHKHDANQIEYPDENLQINVGYTIECKEKCGNGLIPRWKRYADNLEYSGEPIIPELRDRRGIEELGLSFKDKVILAPFSTWEARAWRIESWLTLNHLLQSKGYETVVISQKHKKLELFKNTEIVEEATAAKVAGVLLNAAACVACDSGMSHLAGLLGTSCITLCGQTTGKDIFGLYPSVKSIQGSLLCNGCWWNEPPYDHHACGHCCANLQSITPSQVLHEIDQICLPKFAKDEAVICRGKLAVVRDCLMEVKHLEGDVGEFGVYRGGVAAFIQHYLPNDQLHLYDTFCGMPFGDKHPGGRHRAGDFAGCSMEQVKSLVPKAKLYPGVFPNYALPDVKYKFTHQDFDLQQSAEAAFVYSKPRQVPGSLMLIDDFGWENCPGIKVAVAKCFPGSSIERPSEYQALIRF